MCFELPLVSEAFSKHQQIAQQKFPLSFNSFVQLFFLCWHTCTDCAMLASDFVLMFFSLNQAVSRRGICTVIAHHCIYYYCKHDVIYNISSNIVYPLTFRLALVWVYPMLFPLSLLTMEVEDQMMKIITRGNYNKDQSKLLKQSQ